MAIATPKKLKKNTIQKKIAKAKAKDYGDDPFFIKKAKIAETFLKKNGLPTGLAK